MHPEVENFAREEVSKLSGDPSNLRHFERKVFSQNGEDGILEEILKRINPASQFFVEFGIQNGFENNSRNFLQHFGWKGLWIEGSPDAAEQARQTYGHLPVKIVNRFITRENINSIFKEAGVPFEFDLLCIDIDGNDYWIWQELAGYSPRVVTIEYNSSYPPGQEWIMPYNPNHQWDGTAYFGASLTSLEGLAKSKGYRLVACDSNGVNAFFVRSDLLDQKFSHLEEGSSYHYVSPKFNQKYFGHPANRQELLEQRVELLEVELSRREQEIIKLHEWIAHKEEVAAEQVASLQKHLSQKEREIADLQASISRKEQENLHAAVLPASTNN